MELHFADTNKLKRQGRTFECKDCPVSVQKLRRCREDRWDFTAEDSNVFPIRIQEGGGLYGFCPGKVTWDHEAASLFEMLVTCVELKKLLVEGGLSDQPAWFVGLLAWFAPTYDQHKFVNRAKMVLGDGDDKQQTAKSAKRPGKR